MSKKQESEWIQIIQSGFQLLEEKLAYKQINIVNKLNILEHSVSPATLNKVLNDKGGGKSTLKIIAEGIQKIIASELGYQYNKEQNIFLFSPEEENWRPFLIPEQAEENDTAEEKIIFHAGGRLSIEKKVEFMQRAQREIIEVGVRLHTFSEYFTSRSENEFAMHIEALLKKGVNLKLYLLDPDSNESRIYFNDRGKVQKSELQAIESTKTVIQQLQEIKADFEKKKLSGQFDVFSYKHIPYNHFLITDGETSLGRMMLSHYIYGIRRADCPVIEFSKAVDKNLYERYWKSLQYYIEGAKKLT